MKPLEKQTAYLLLKATTNSQWDVCDFALISISENWKKDLEKRLSNLMPFIEDPMFISMSFYDLGVEFYKNSNETLRISAELLDNRDSMLILADEQLIESLPIPENCLDCHELVCSETCTFAFSICDVDK